MRKSNWFYISTFIFLIPNLILSQWTPTNGPYGGRLYSLLEMDNGLVALAGTKDLYIAKLDSIQWSKIPSCCESIKQLYCKGESLYALTPEGIYMSSNLGANWNEAFASYPYKNVNNMLVRDGLILISADTPNNSVALLASYDNGATWSDIKINGNRVVGERYGATNDGKTIAIGMANGLYLSTDGGANWEKELEAVYPDLTEFFCFCFSGDTLFAGSNKGMHYSYDAGKTWKDVTIVGGVSKIVPSGEDLFVTLNYGGFRKIEKKASGYALSTQGLENLIIRDLVVRDGNLFVSTDVGCLVSKDMGANWQEQNEGIRNAILLSSYKIGDRFFVSALDHGVQYTTNYGEEWIMTPKNSVYDVFQNVEVLDDIAYGLTYPFPSTLKISTDKGNSWNSESQEMTAKKIYCVLPLPGGACLIGTSQGIYKRIDTNVWEEVDSNLRETNINSLSKCGDVLLAGSNNGILRSVDGGPTWEYSDYPFDFMDGVAVVSSDKLVIVFSGSTTIYLSTDAGLNWTALKAPMEVVQRPVILGRAFILTSSLDNMYYTKDLGSTWKAIGDDIASEGIAYINVFDDRIFAGTYKAGLFRANLFDFGISGARDISTTKKPVIFPNPASDFIEAGGAEEPCVVELYNSLGTKSLSATNAERIYIGGLPQGVYFCVIRSGEKLIFSNLVIER